LKLIQYPLEASDALRYHPGLGQRWGLKIKRIMEGRKGQRGHEMIMARTDQKGKQCLPIKRRQHGTIDLDKVKEKRDETFHNPIRQSARYHSIKGDLRPDKP